MQIPSLSELIGHVHSWNATYDGIIPNVDFISTDLSKKYSVLALQGFDLHYSWGELSAIDQHLVGVMQYQGQLTDEQLTMNVEYFTEKKLTLPNIDYKTGKILGDFRVRFFESFTPVPNSDEVIVKSHRYDLVKPKEGVTHPFRVVESHLRVPITWLNTHYPKWQDASLLSLSLDLDPASLTKLITDEMPPACNVAIDGIEFD